MLKATLYVSFAVIATIINLLTQVITASLFHGPIEILVSMFIGTLAGLVVKYLLDKKYIFKFKAENQKKNMKTFFFYSSMGLVTTLLFWITEYTFDLWFATKTMRYVGAVIGLSIGYVAKYQLDKKYVFIAPYDKKSNQLG